MQPFAGKTFLRQVQKNWSTDNIPSLSAALAYYMIFSLVPLLIVTISIASLLLGRQGAEERVLSELSEVMGPQSADFIRSLIHLQPTTTSLATSLISGAITLLAAGGVASYLQQSLDIIWKTPAHKRSGWKKVLRNKLVSFAVIVVLGLLLIALFLASTILQIFGSIIHAGVLLQVGNVCLFFLINILLFSLMYKFLPNTPTAWKDCLLGGAVTSLLFTLGRFGVGAYLESQSMSAGFGAAASLIVILLGTYYFSLIFFLGAEMSYTYTKLYGSLKERVTFRNIWRLYFRKKSTT